MNIKLNGKAMLGLVVLSSSFVFADFIAVLSKRYVIIQDGDSGTPQPPEKKIESFLTISNEHGICRKWDHGFLECYGSTGTMSGGSNKFITYPHPFKEGAKSVKGSSNDKDTIYTIVGAKERSAYHMSTGNAANVGNNDNTGFTVFSHAGRSNNGDWISTGYWK